MKENIIGFCCILKMCTWGKMRVVSFIEKDTVIEKILRHCGLWEEPPIRPPPTAPPVVSPEIRALDYGFYERTCA